MKNSSLKLHYIFTLFACTCAGSAAARLIYAGLSEEIALDKNFYQFVIAACLFGLMAWGSFRFFNNIAVTVNIVGKRWLMAALVILLIVYVVGLILLLYH